MLQLRRIITTLKPFSHCPYTVARLYCNASSHVYESPSPHESSNSEIAHISTARSVPHTRAEMYQKLLMLQPKSPPDSRVLKVAVLGCPNAGKSSLVNMLVNWRVCAISQKVNTTRTKQTAVLTKENVQLIFVDLPGIVGKEKARNHKLDKSIMRDPHAGIFESDLILVLVDITHKYSQRELDKEVIKALHFFNDKPSILVLNKVDVWKRNRFRLLDVTRVLTNGVVAGKVSHIDRFKARHSRDTPAVSDLLQHPKTLALLEQHTRHKEVEGDVREGEGDVREVANDVRAIEDGSSDEIAVDMAQYVEYVERGDDAGLEIENSAVSSIDNSPSSHSEDANEVETSLSPTRHVEDSDLANITAFFRNYKRQKQSETESVSVAPETEADLDPVIHMLEKQLMLGSTSPEDVRLRREKWREIGERVRGETAWQHFDEVFMVSSATGEGIDPLRNYLFNRAHPGEWSFHESLVTDQDPVELVRMSVWSQCLEVLEHEIPYYLTIVLNDYEKSPDGTIFISAEILCRSERHLVSVIGVKGAVIKKIAAAAKLELVNIFQTDVVLKLAVSRKTIPKGQLRAIKKSGDFRKAFPDLNMNA